MVGRQAIAVAVIVADHRRDASPNLTHCLTSVGRLVGAPSVAVGISVSVFVAVAAGLAVAVDSTVSGVTLRLSRMLSPPVFISAS